MGMHRDQARKAAGRARIAAAGLAVVGGVVLFAPFPKLDAAPAPGPGSTGVLPPAPGPKPSPAFDPSAAELVLKNAGPDPRPAAAPPDDTVTVVDPEVDPGQDQPPVEPSAGGPTLRYLGPIVGPRRTLAMVALDGQQHVVAIGEKIQDKTVVDVKPDQVILHDEAGVEHIVQMADRVLDWSMDPPAPRPGYQSKKMPSAAAKGAALNEHENHENEAQMDVELKRQMEARQAEARRLAEQERGGTEDHANGGPNTTAPPRPRPPGPAGAAPKAPTTPRGGNAPGVTPPRVPPVRPAAPGSTKGGLDTKKGGNQV